MNNPAVLPDFDAALLPLDSDGQTQVPPTWGQGRATFGGLVAALLLRRAQAVLAGRGLAAGKPPRALAFSLVAPLAPGPAQVDVEVLRAGKSVVQVEARVLQEGQVAAVMLASFGAARVSEVLVAPAAVPDFPPPQALPVFPYVPGVTPEFTQHFEFRWGEGQIPFSGPPASTADMGGWVRFRRPVRNGGAAHLLGLIDAWPPAVLPMFRRPAPISTQTWSLEFTAAAHDPGLAVDDAWFGYLAQTELSAEGYAHVASRFWRADGVLLALGRQSIAIFT